MKTVGEVRIEFKWEGIECKMNTNEEKWIKGESQRNTVKKQMWWMNQWITIYMIYEKVNQEEMDK